MPAAKRRWETPQILSDLPLRESDTTHFHFDEFAVTLARLVADPATRTPLTIGINGPWGSGKTTLLRRIKTLLDMRDKDENPFYLNANENSKNFRTCKTVWFDAWKYNEEDTLLVALVRVILGTMGRGTLGEQLWSEILDKTAPRYDVLATFLNMFKLKYGGLEIGIDLNEYKTDTEFYKHTAFLDHFNAAFEELLARWVHGKGDITKIDESKGALVVFIDDLDRCLPAKTVQVLEAVKLFLDKSGCVFLLGADTKIVQDAVVKHYNDAGIRDENVGDYIEKLIQLRFELPPILEKQMGDFVTAQGLPSAALEHWETIVAGAEINPRKVKTFLNDLNLAWAVLVNSGQAQNVDRADFTRWQVLMRAAPEGFKKQVSEIDVPEIRFKFVQNALAWQKGDTQAAENFKDYEKHARLKRTLRKISAFSPHFNADVLDAFIHMTEPPRLPEPEKVPVEMKDSILQETLETAIDEPVKQVKRRAAVSEKGKRAEAVPSRANVQVFGGLEFVPVPKGKFLMGSREDNRLAYPDEQPQHPVEITADYWLARFPVTNRQYAEYIEAANEKHEWVRDWKKKTDHPVVNVSWNAAQAYCAWLNKMYKSELPKGFEFHLPTEAEWEKGARGEFGLEWPWGNEFDADKCNSAEGNKKGNTTPVGQYSPMGDSPYGAADMVGNVWEWTQSLSKGYPYVANDGREDMKGGGLRVLRGGSFYNLRDLARCAYRNWLDPRGFDYSIGFRVCVSPIPSL
jgi:formylglycine-generating enzyme required for sulfatase activity/tRNA A37 threonylcarbamoyladenosine biosynthesis protein TsaE